MGFQNRFEQRLGELIAVAKNNLHLSDVRIRIARGFYDFQVLSFPFGGACINGQDVVVVLDVRVGNTAVVATKPRSENFVARKLLLSDPFALGISLLS